jgi:hypothetical protein
VIGLIVIIVLTLFFAGRGIARQKLTANKPKSGEGSVQNPALSFAISATLCVIFAWAGYTSLEWPAAVRQAPLLICVPGTILAGFVAVRDFRSLLKDQKSAGSWGVTLRNAYEEAWFGEALPFFAYLIGGIIMLTLLVGQKIAIPLFIGLYLWRWGGYSKRIVFGYALVGWALTVFFYGEVMSMLFHPSYLQLWLQDIAPDGFPDWLIV